jgi:putative photosynthetic complex assembly protein
LNKKLSGESMSTTGGTPIFPRWFLYGVGGLMIVTMIFAFVARQTDTGALRVSRAPDVAQLAIRFDEQADGSVLVRRIVDDHALEILPRDGSTFLRGVLRSLQRERAMRRVDRDAPFMLVRRLDARHAMIDPVTGSRIELDGFGPSHSAAMARLMDLGLATASPAILAGQVKN